jgi:hypothetical protein
MLVYVIIICFVTMFVYIYASVATKDVEIIVVATKDVNVFGYGHSRWQETLNPKDENLSC